MLTYIDYSRELTVSDHSISLAPPAEEQRIKLNLLTFQFEFSINLNSQIVYGILIFSVYRSAILMVLL